MDAGTELPGKNLSFNTQIKTDTAGMLAEGQIHSDPREQLSSLEEKCLRRDGSMAARPSSSLVASFEFYGIPLLAKTSLLSPASAW